MTLSQTANLLLENARLQRTTAKKSRALGDVVYNEDAAALLCKYAEELEARAAEIERMVQPQL